MEVFQVLKYRQTYVSRALDYYIQVLSSASTQPETDMNHQK